ncbi:MAG TPA: NAD-dependent epimerase/dehydratase family protein [Flavitalea sp.]|nr:NAD-dependent epimerase/dehydratase family protein [Flavitalea sp.]
MTGGTGFLGAYIIRELVEKGYTVRALRRGKKQSPFYIPSHIFEKVDWIEGDILDVIALEEAMAGIDAVIHAAAKVCFNPGDRSEMYKSNIEGTANVVNVALESGIKKMIHVSSVAALGRTKNGDTVDEEKKWEESSMNTNYALSKYHAEMEVWRGMGEGLNVTVVNPSTILGYGDWNTTSCAIFRNVYKGLSWYTKGINGFVDVEDVANVTVRLLEAETSGERFILNGDNWPFQQLLNEIAGGFNKKLPYREATKFLAELAWRYEKVKSVITGKAPLVTKESARVSQTKTFFNNNKIKTKFPGFSFTPLSESIQKACKNYLVYPRLMP